MKRLIKYIIFVMLLTTVFLSGCDASTNKSEQTDPFGHIYRVSDVNIPDESFAEIKETTLVNLSGLHSLWIMEDTTTYEFTRLGELEEAALTEGDTRKALWVLEDASQRYEITIEEDDSVVLSKRSAGQESWSCKLIRVDMISANVSTFGKREFLVIDWYFAGTFSGDLSQLTSATVRGKGKLGFSVKDESIDAITVIEEYYTDGNVEYAEYRLTKEEGFQISAKTKYDAGEQYAIYRIPYDNGEYVFFVKYQ